MLLVAVHEQKTTPIYGFLALPVKLNRYPGGTPTSSLGYTKLFVLGFGAG